MAVSAPAAYFDALWFKRSTPLFKTVMEYSVKGNCTIVFFSNKVVPHVMGYRLFYGQISNLGICQPIKVLVWLKFYPAFRPISHQKPVRRSAANGPPFVAPAAPWLVARL